MGTGKSAVGERLASAVGVSFVDLDALIVQRTQRTIAQIFQERGEPYFRKVERDLLEETLSVHSDAVFALGGGTLLNRSLRHRVLELGCVISLSATAETIAKRLEDDPSRPLLDGASLSRIDEVLEARSEMYAEAHLCLSTESRTLDDVVNDALRFLSRPAFANALTVPLGARTYPVVFEPSGIRHLGQTLDQFCVKTSKIFVVTDTEVRAHWLEPLVSALAPRDINVVELASGEQHKTLSSVQLIWDSVLNKGIDRHACLIALGGGVVGDLTGFAAASLLRGLRWIQIPTTLLAMVDSSVGGKTGFDHPLGKNLIGAFHQPSAVVCDVKVLQTLPVAERIAGLAEVVKSAFIDGPSSVEFLEKHVAELLAGEESATLQAVRQSIALKARIVASDEFETKGQRALLNFGHTWGHALEAALGFGVLRHGEAVSIGMMAAAQISLSLKVCQKDFPMRLKSLLSSLGLPTDFNGHLPNEAIWGHLGHDKKSSGSSVRWILPKEIGLFEQRLLTVQEARQHLLAAAT